MRQLIFDIETVGADFEQLDRTTQEYFLKFADTPEKAAEVKASTSFYPLTGQIVAIAMLDANAEQGVVHYQNGEGRGEKVEDAGVVLIPGSEPEILDHFWRITERYDQLVSFNGRIFDGPFIMLRSAINCIRTRKNLLPYRYSPGVHIDLADQMTFYDAMRRRFGLHTWCKAFSIPSPKECGVVGAMVKDLYVQGRYLEIARYCMEDVKATKKLYEYWDKYLRF